ncbi:hypothetical protein C8J56DRAFT_362847 [Mycena floridula]|nr:hypothetical protein C8J56DRAFT_362847 [Mycena floridula]
MHDKSWSHWIVSGTDAGNPGRNNRPVPANHRHPRRLYCHPALLNSLQKSNSTRTNQTSSLLGGNGTLDDRMMLMSVIEQCGTLLLSTVRQDGYLSVLDALKGSSGILFSISRASHIIQPADKLEVIEIYAGLLKEITINLIHPAVMRRCSRRLQKHAFLLKPGQTHLRLIAEASKVLISAVTWWKTRRTKYKAEQSPKSCGNPECPQLGMNLNTLKFCTGCLTVVYCSATCQKSDWKLHQLQCDSLASERIRNQAKGIDAISALHMGYLKWIIQEDASQLAPSPEDHNADADSLLELDYSVFPVKTSLIRIADFLERPVRFPKDEPVLRARIVDREEGSGMLKYAIVPNGMLHSFPILL